MATNELATPADDIMKQTHGVWARTPLCIYGENEEHMKLLFLDIFKEIKPRDVFEDEWIIDIFDFTWTITRLRDLKVYLLNASAYLGLEKILTPLIGATDAVGLASDWHAGDETANKRVNEILASAKVRMPAVMAETLAIRLLEVERIDRMIHDAMAGRSAIFREIERHRSPLARQLRNAVNQVEDAEYKEVNDGSNGKPS